MTKPALKQRNLNQPKSAAAAPPHRFLPLLLALFIGSGCAALIYEVVWLQLLQLVIGSSAVSLGDWRSAVARCF
jgi:hypothetical protein